MPCFSATSYTQLNSQPPTSTRGKSSLRSARHRNSTHFDYTQIPTQIRKQCVNMFEVKGYNAEDVGLKARKKPVKPAKREPKKTVLGQQDLQRLKEAATVKTMDDRMADLLREQERKHQLGEMADAIKARFHDIDETRRKLIEEEGDKNVDEGANEKVKVLERAFLAKQEQEEEVKQLNRLILNAKCNAVRDAQLQEKLMIEKELREEKRRIEKGVTDNAVNALDNDDNNDIKIKQKQQKYAAEIKEQLRERENLRFLESERLEYEAKMVRRAEEAYKKEEERQKELSRERRRQLREDYARILEMNSVFKRMLCEQEREADMRINAYLREKHEREKKLEHEQKLIKQAYERKQATLYMLAQKVLESRSQRDEMGYIREQEQIEREYRRKELEAAKRKKQYEKELCENRQKQLQEIKHRRAIQIARAEEDFNALLEKLRLDEQAEIEKQKNLQCRRNCYRKDIMQQMADKEMERRHLEELNKRDAFAFKEMEQQRNANIKAVVDSKLDAMRQACLPEKYIKDVEKQLLKIQSKQKL